MVVPNRKEFAERLTLELEKRGIMQKEIVELLKKDQPTVSRWLNGDSLPRNKDDIIRICDEYGIDFNYLLTGEEEEHPRYSERQIPLYDITFQAGALPMLNNVQQPLDPVHWITIPFLQEGEFSVFVDGDSMYPKFQAGDIVVLKQIKGREFILGGKTYGIVTKTDNFRTIKKLFECPDDDRCFVLRSINKNYPDQKIKKEEILHIYLVCGGIVKPG